MLIENRTNFTSEVIPATGAREVFVAVDTLDASATVEIHLKRPDGVFRTYPSMIVKANELALLVIPPSEWKVVIKGTNVTVELL